MAGGTGWKKPQAKVCRGTDGGHTWRLGCNLKFRGRGRVNGMWHTALWSEHQPALPSSRLL